MRSNVGGPGSDSCSRAMDIAITQRMSKYSPTTSDISKKHCWPMSTAMWPLGFSFLAAS